MTPELEEMLKTYLKENLKVTIETKRDCDSNIVYINVQTFISDERISYSEDEIDVEDTYRNKYND